MAEAAEAYQALDVSATAFALQQKQHAVEQFVAQGQTAAAAVAASIAKQAEWLKVQGYVAQQIGVWQTQWIAAISQVRQGSQASGGGGGCTASALTSVDWQNPETLAAGHHAAAQVLVERTNQLQAAEAGEQAIQRAQTAANQSAHALQAAQGQQALLQQAADDTQLRHDSLVQTGRTNQQDLTAIEASLQATLFEAGYALPSDTQPWLQERALEWQHWRQTQRHLQELAQAIIRQQAQRDATQAATGLWAQRWAARDKQTQLQLQAQALTLLAPNEVAALLAALEAQRSILSEQIGAKRALLASEAPHRQNQQAPF